MGTRANFYIGMGEDIKFLKWIKWDGYPWYPGIMPRKPKSLRDLGKTSMDMWPFDNTILKATTKEEYLERLEYLVKNCDKDVAKNVTDHSIQEFNYTFYDGLVYLSPSGFPWMAVSLFLHLNFHNESDESYGKYFDFIEWLFDSFGYISENYDIKKVKFKPLENIEDTSKISLKEVI